MPAGKRKRYQYAAIVFRLKQDGAPEILLVTSRETRRWILPKGWPKRGYKAWQVAAQEVFEEAGILGAISSRAIGAYSSVKRLADGVDVPCTVSVFLFRADSELSDWPEMHQRERRWMSVREAADLASEPEMAALLRQFGALWTG